MCKSGQVADAYGLAKAACEAEPQNVWAQRGVGWVLYYMLKNDVQSISVSFTHMTVKC